MFGTAILLAAICASAVHGNIRPDYSEAIAVDPPVIQPSEEEQFKDADKNGDGKLNFTEYLMMDKFWVDMQRENFKNRDANGDGFVTLKEEQDYQKKMDDEAKKQKEAYMQELFSQYDENKDGLLQKTEVANYADQYLGVVTDQAFDDFFKKSDVNKDGKLNYGEFKSFDADWLNAGLNFKPVPTNKYLAIDPPMPTAITTN